MRNKDLKRFRQYSRSKGLTTGSDQGKIWDLNGNLDETSDFKDEVQELVPSKPRTFNRNR